MLVRITPFLLGLSLLLATSCNTTLKPLIPDPQRQEINTSTLYNLDCEFSMVSYDSSHEKMTFATVFSMYFNYDRQPDKNDRVRIHVLDEHRLELMFYDDNYMFHKRIVNGSIKNGCFEYTARQFYCRILFNIFGKITVRIGLLQNGDITIDAKSRQVGVLGILPTTYAINSYHNLKFRKWTE